MSNYAVVLSDKASDILFEALRSEFRTFRRTPVATLNPDDLPILAVFVTRERRVADGDANQGEPKFIHNMTLAVAGSVSIMTDDENRMMNLEQTMTQAEDLILTNAKF